MEKTTWEISGEAEDGVLIVVEPPEAWELWFGDAEEPGDAGFALAEGSSPAALMVVTEVNGTPLCPRCADETGECACWMGSST